MDTQMLSRFQYPFPMLKNPYAEQLQDITDNQWIDDEYLCLYKDDPFTRYKYKKTKTAHIASQWFLRQVLNGFGLFVVLCFGRSIMMIYARKQLP